MKVLESNLSLIAIPIVLNKLNDFDEKASTQRFYSFAAGLSLACIICLINALYNFGKTGNTDFFFFYHLTDVLNFQPTYFAYYLIFTVTFSLYLLFYQENEGYRLAKIICIVFLFLILMLTGGQTAFVSMLLIFAFFILKFLTEEKSNAKRQVVIVIVFMLLCMFATTIVTKESRTVMLSDSWDRLVLWESAIDAIPNLLLGVGTGDYKDVLNDYYIGHGLERFANESYNSHNQFIQTLFSNGILGVFAMVLMVTRPLYLSYKKENILGILSLFPFLIYGITEVFLGRYQGIVFFAFIHQFFITQLNSKAPLLAKQS